MPQQPQRTAQDAPDGVLELREAIQMMMAAPERMALLDEHGRISAINPAWRDSGRRGGSIAATGRGVDYLALCDQAAEAGEADARAFATALRQVMGRETPMARVTFTWLRPNGEEARSMATARCIQGPLENWFLVTYGELDGDERTPIALPEAQLTLSNQATRSELERQLEGVASHVALLESDGTIAWVNEAWQSFAAKTGASADATGQGANYLAECERAVRTGDRRGAQFAEGLRMVLGGKRRSWWLDSRINVDGSIQLFRGRVARVDTPDGPLTIVAHTDIAESAAATRTAA